VATGNVWTYAFDQRDRMTGATEKNSGGSTIMQATFTYDALGRRIGTKVDDDGSGPHAAVQTWMVYDGGGSDANTYADFDGSGNLLTRYLYAPAVDAILARTSSGGTSAWYLPEKLGTIRDIADTSGALIDHVVYNSFGAVTSETNSANGDRFKFAGREYDRPSGLYYYRARYCDPPTGRFIGRDPMGFAAAYTDLYQYAGNDPTGLKDSTGERPTAQGPGPLPRRPDDPIAPAPALPDDLFGPTDPTPDRGRYHPDDYEAWIRLRHRDLLRPPPPDVLKKEYDASHGILPPVERNPGRLREPIDEPFYYPPLFPPKLPPPFKGPPTWRIPDPTIA
jgi:RHS repeat-associated protein